MAADAGYASIASYARLEAQRVIGLIPPQPGAQHSAAEHARTLMQTPVGRSAALDRQAHAEGAIAELKRHGLGRARCRSTRLLHLQLLAAATAINLKRLMAAGRSYADGQPGDPDSRAPRLAAIAAHLCLLRWLDNEIGRLTAADPSTGS